MATLDVTKYADFTTAISSIGVAIVELIVSSEVIVSTAITVPSNISVRVEGAGKFTASGGTHSIQFNGPYQAPHRKTFFGFSAGEITFKNVAQPAIVNNFWTGTTGPVLSLSSGDSGCAVYPHTRFLIEDDTFAYLQFSTPGSVGEASGLLFGDAASNIAGILDYDHGTDHMFFFTNSVQRMRITDNGVFIFDPGIPIGGTVGFPGDNIDPQSAFHVYQGKSSGTAFPTAIMTLEDDASIFLQFLTPNTSYAGMCIGDPQAQNAATFYYDNSVDRWLYYVGATERMRIDNTHGVRAPDLRVWNGSSAGTAYSASHMVIEDDTSTFLQFLTPSSQYGGILFGDPQNNLSGAIYYNHGQNQMILDTMGTNRMIINSSGKTGFGMGTNSIETRLHIYKDSSAGGVASNSFAGCTIENGTSVLLQFLTTNGLSGFLCGDSSANDAGAFYYRHSDDTMLFSTNATERFRIDSQGNMGVGAQSFGASATKVIAIGNGTAPSTNITGGQLYVEGGALKYRSSSGTVTTIGPL